MREILYEFEHKPALCAIFPNIIQFMGEENQSLMKQSRPLGKLQMLILKVIKAVIYN
jgi:hypothetical protein